jgi:hypothetical protein
MLAIYAAQWEWQARRREEHSVEAHRTWLARAACLATPPTPFRDRSLTERATLKRLVNALGHTG